jgi:hypothetical protein
MMEDTLRTYLKSKCDLDPDYNSYGYYEDINKDAATNKWLDSQTSFVWKVGVLSIIDSNKCDWVHFALAIQKTPHSEIDIIGHFNFCDGENDDIGRVLKRMIGCLKQLHPVFEED